MEFQPEPYHQPVQASGWDISVESRYGLGGGLCAMPIVTGLQMAASWISDLKTPLECVCQHITKDGPSHNSCEHGVQFQLEHFSNCEVVSVSQMHIITCRTYGRVLLPLRIRRYEASYLDPFGIEGQHEANIRQADAPN